MHIFFFYKKFLNKFISTFNCKHKRNPRHYSNSLKLKINPNMITLILLNNLSLLKKVTKTFEWKIKVVYHVYLWRREGENGVYPERDRVPWCTSCLKYKGPIIYYTGRNSFFIILKKKNNNQHFFPLFIIV